MTLIMQSTQIFSLRKLYLLFSYMFRHIGIIRPRYLKVGGYIIYHYLYCRWILTLYRRSADRFI